MPLGVGVLFFPIEIGMVLTISPLRLMVRVLVLSSAVPISESPMVKLAERLRWPNKPSPRSTPKVLTATSTVVPGTQKSLGRQRTSRLLNQ